ncbi:MAG: LysM peptidoglycan-binding domain-containing protein [Anaerolineae bacterium]|nr:LysM peptidoglycan-binding domain-containing protein [Anaerolineae bacterium]
MRKQRFVTVRYIMTALLVCASVGLYLNASGRTVGAFQTGNLLQNPGFEEPFVAINGDTTLRVAASWQPWSLPEGASSAINARPEYKPAPSNRIYSGNAAQEYNTFYATHTGGVYQRVPVTLNTELRFSVFVYVWSSAAFLQQQDVSEDPNDVKVRVGIDPKGGTDGTSPNIVWSSDSEFYDQWRELSVVATAQNTAVTVFVRSAPEGFVGTSNIYLDDAALLPLGEAPPTATLPGPTNTPDIFVPTQEGTVTPVQATLTPTPLPATATPDNTSTVVYTVQAGDTVSAIARRYNTTIDAIGKVNGLTNVGLIYVGQTLLIPVSSGGQTTPPTFTPVPTDAGTENPPQPGVGSYTIVSGDTLYGIAARFNTTAATLAQLNNIVNPNLIYPGQVISVPGAAQPAPAPAATPEPSAPAPQPNTHVVQAGENLFRISLRYNVTVDALARANNIYNTNLIFPGQVLAIP